MFYCKIVEMVNGFYLYNALPSQRTPKRFSLHLVIYTFTQRLRLKGSGIQTGNPMLPVAISAQNMFDFIQQSFYNILSIPRCFLWKKRQTFFLVQINCEYK